MLTRGRADALAARFIGFLTTSEADPELFSEGVFWDFTLPRWRLQPRVKARCCCCAARATRDPPSWETPPQRGACTMR
jgi:hypothetical protein